MNYEKKEEYRYQFAGMAMQAMLNAIWSNSKTQDEAISNAKRLGYSSVCGLVTAESVEYANRLIKELEQEEEQ